jgi:hypothetical protein
MRRSAVVVRSAACRAIFCSFELPKPQQGDQRRYAPNEPDKLGSDMSYVSYMHMLLPLAQRFTLAPHTGRRGICSAVRSQLSY